MAGRVLYDHPMSGNCQKVHLILHALDLPYDTRAVDLEGRAQDQDWFRALNPLGQVPVLVEDGVAWRDSQAILVALALRHGSDLIDPSPEGMAAIQPWLSFAAHEVSLGCQMARLYHLTGRAEVGIDAARAMGLHVLSHLDRHLSGQDWLCLGRASIADLAVSPYVALARDGRLPLDDYPSVLAWLARIAALPFYRRLRLLPRYRGLPVDPRGYDGAED